MADWDAERRARLALACVSEPGRTRLVSLLPRFSAEEVWARLSRGGASAEAKRATTVDVAAVIGRTEACGARFVIPGDDEWPGALDVLGHCEPVHDMGGGAFGLWMRGPGALSGLASRSAAVVGARACTSYGERVASELAGGLASERVTVVSGGAFGIDAAAHRGALADGGPTVAVLACGVDVPYPLAHEALLGRVADTGLVISEHPPGERPTRARFLARNRLIAALSGGTVVVEAAVRSGACNTAAWARSCGRVLMAVPGPVSSALSFTPHRLIRDGEAILVTTAHQVVAEVSPIGEVVEQLPLPTPRALDALSDVQRAVLDAVPSRGGRGVDDLALRTGLAVFDCLAALGHLAGEGWVRQRDDGTWGLGRTNDRPTVGARGGPGG